TPLRTLTGPREYVARPVFTPEGEIIYSDSDGYTRPQLRRLDPRTGQVRTELLVDGAGGPAITGDGRSLAFHAVDVWSTNYFYNDLYLYQRERRQKRRLTFGLRATNPGISPDGSRIVFEVNDVTSRGLGMAQTDACGPDACPVEMLIPAAGLEQVY